MGSGGELSDATVTVRVGTKTQQLLMSLTAPKAPDRQMLSMAMDTGLKDIISSAIEDVPSFDFECMAHAIYVFDTGEKDGAQPIYEISRLSFNFGTRDPISPMTGRPTPADSDRTAFVLHTHFYDKDRKYNPPTLQDIKMFCVYRAFSILRDWKPLRTAELVAAHNGLYIISDLPKSRFSLTSYLVGLLRVKPWSAEELQNKLLAGVESALAEKRFSISPDSERVSFVDLMCAPFPNLSKPDQGDPTKLTFMHNPHDHCTYMKVFEIIGVSVVFSEWPADFRNVSLTFKTSSVSIVPQLT